KKLSKIQRHYQTILHLFKSTQNYLGIEEPHQVKRIRSILKQNHYDYIVVRHVATLSLCPYLDKSVIVDIDDMPEQILSIRIRESEDSNRNWIQQLSWNCYNAIEKKLVGYHTNRMVRKVKNVYIPDKKYYARYSNAIYLSNIPYPFSEVAPTVTLPNPNEILFVGLLFYFPNCSGISHFLSSIWPIILQKNPEVHFNIVGSLASVPENDKRQWENSKGVSLKGFVDNIAQEYANSSVVVAPIFEGGGTNIKVLEAMQQGKACVISMKASRGFEDLLMDGYNIMIAQNDQEFADKVLQLLSDTQLNQDLGANAKKTVQENFSFESFTKAVHSAF
ncbi:MAG: glycosyltransferase family 4 protein, partial [Mediterranea sp.]|nr:glycosyltransferase family 4 protein [Mediterranea sp.]